RHLAPEVDPPDVLRLLDEAQLGVRDTELRRPAERIARDLPLPHPVPRVIVPLVVVQRAVGERPRSVDAEVLAAAAGVIWADLDGQAIGVGLGLTPPPPGHER